MLRSFVFIFSLLSNFQEIMLQGIKTSHHSHLLFVFEKIVTSITKTFTECSYFNYVQDSYINPNEFSGESEIRFLLNLHPNASKTPTPVPPYNYKHNVPCSVVFFDLQVESILDSAAVENSTTIENRWPLRMLMRLPSSIHKSFFIFFSNGNRPMQMSKLNQFLQLIGPIQHALFVIPQTSAGTINIYKGVSQSGHPLQRIATSCSMGDFKVNPQTAVFSRIVNFNGAIIKFITCIGCIDHDEFLRTGIGREAIAHLWPAIVEQLNGTVEFEHVLETPGPGVKFERNENGQTSFIFDELMLPIAEGYAAVTGPLINAQHVQQVSWLTRPLLYDSVLFMIAKPQLQQFDSLSVLREPLDDQVWLGFLLSFLACALFMCFVQRRNEGKGNMILAIGKLFRPVLNQSSTFKIEYGAPKAVFGLWLLFMLTLGCGYNSKIVASIVFPRYMSVPQTFKQLADSDYDVGIVFPNAVKESLVSLNTTVSVKLAERGQDIDFGIPLCYVMLLKGPNACIGPWAAFERFGMPFMMDVDGRILSVRSEEGMLTSYAGPAVSRNYPMIIEPLDRQLGLGCQSGLYDYASKYYMAATTKKGRRWAKAHAQEIKLYSRQSASATDDAKVVGIVLRILQFGFCLAALAFCTEILPKFFLKMKKVAKTKFCIMRPDFDAHHADSVNSNHDLDQNNAKPVPQDLEQPSLQWSGALVAKSFIRTSS